MEDKIIVAKLVNEEIIVGENECFSGNEVTTIILNPVRYQVRGNEVFLTPFFGNPEAIVVLKERFLYMYEITDANLVKKYKDMVSKSSIKLVNKDIILAS